MALLIGNVVALALWTGWAFFVRIPVASC